MICIFTFVVFLSSAAFAVDIITRKSDGKKLNGSITGMSKDDLTLKRSQGGEEVISLNDIEWIEWEGGAGELNSGYNDEKKGRYEQALQRFAKAKNDAKSPSSFLQGEFEYVTARVLAKTALIDPEKREQAIQALIAAQKAHPDHVRFYESVLLLTQLQLAKKDFDGARKTLDVLKKASSDSLNFKARLAEGRVLASEGKFEESISEFAAVAESAGNSPENSTIKNDAMIGQARGLIARTRFDEALKMLQPITEKRDGTDDSAAKAEALLLEGQAQRGLGMNRLAILAYLNVDIIYFYETDFHAEALYQLVNLWKLVQQPDRSAEAAEKLVQLYPKSEWRKKLAE